jgi:hypothetical protein
MTDVRGITGVNPADLASAKIRRVEKPPEAGPVVDKVEISTATAKAAEVAMYSELAKATPEVRLELIRQAQERVASGAYLKPEVTLEVAKKIAEAM